MMLSSLFNLCLLAVVTLDGLTGDHLTARASFDANNVRVGDPMTLTIDFIGSASFSDLHPPALSREVDGRIWLVDDVSAKTKTYLNARRLVYRVIPRRAGLNVFPALTFAFDGGTAGTRAIPVHVKPGVQAALSALDDGGEKLPMPDGLVLDVASCELSEDDAFAWRKACSRASAEAFAEFDFPEARLNEAACLILEGNWARAMKLYGRLEWQIGQSPAIERGIVAALARKTSDPAQELPAWRLAFRPVLRYAWPGRLGVVAGSVLALALVFWLCGKTIRKLAVVALVLALARPACAQGIFEEMDRLMQEHFKVMNSSFGSFGGGFGGQMFINGQEQEPVRISASVALSTQDIRVGETFRFLLSLEAPKAATLDQISLTPSEMFGMVVMGKVESLEDGVAVNPSNRVRRLSVPVRYDVPFTGQMTFRVDGMVHRRQTSGRSSFSFSQNFSVESPAVAVEIKPLPTDGQPDDFSGAIGTGFKLARSLDRTRVETNDVVKLTYTLEFSGYVPLGAVPDELERTPGRRVVWQDYFVADGTREIPPESLVYYDTNARAYRRVETKRTALEYVAPAETETEAVAVDAEDGKSVTSVKLRFAPNDSSPVVETVALAAGESLRETARRGDWVRYDSGRHAGWTRERKELEP